jgi:hypothetical protein
MLDPNDVSQDLLVQVLLRLAQDSEEIDAGVFEADIPNIRVLVSLRRLLINTLVLGEHEGLPCRTRLPSSAGAEDVAAAVHAMLVSTH